MWYRVPCPHRLWSSYPILDWFLSRSAVRPAGILGFPSTGLMFLIPGSHVYLSRGYPLSSSIIKQTHNLIFFCISFSSNFLKVWWRVKAAVNMDGMWKRWACPLLSPRPPFHLAPSGALPSRPFFSPVNMLPVSLPLLHSSYSSITSPSSESSDICWTLWFPVAPMLVFISSRGRRGRLWWVGWAQWVGWNPVYQGQDFWPGPNHITSVLQLPYL